MNDEFAATFEARLAEGAQVFGVTGALCRLDRLTALARLVLEHNARAGLTRIIDPIDMAGKHFLDSLNLISCADWGEVRTAVDVGSGAGFPGLVLALCLDGVRFTLLESNAKKVSFLQLAAGELGVEVEVVHVRAEDYGQRGAAGRERFDIGLARAAARLAVSCEYVLPLVRKDGAYLAQVGPDDGARLEPLRAAGQEGAAQGRLPWLELGATLEALIGYELPWDQGCRYVARFRKTQITPAIYPRRAGTPSRKPLAGF